MYKIFLRIFAFHILSGRATDDYDENPYVIVPTSSPTTENVPDVPDPNVNFTALDLQIMKGLQGLFKGNGSNVIEATKRYYIELQDLAIAMEHSKNGGFALLEILDLREGPTFIKAKINEELLRNKYKWDRNQFNELMKNINGTRWSMDRLNIAKNATSVEIPEDEVSSIDIEPTEGNY